MMAFLSARLGKAGAILLILLSLFALGSFGFWQFLATYDRIIQRAVDKANDERNAFWKGEIEKANRIAAQNIIEQMKRSQLIEAQAQTAVDEIQSKLTNMEKANAALPDNPSCGIERSRIRLLQQSPL
ncbi:hypothetical protein HBA92_17365 [Ochrobactrum sp. MR28]|nr:hypothetical protein [Ochrobactrum sp. MR28]MBX8818001.1 hypothetical protein [Ochrobactrum sp. MR31]